MTMQDPESRPGICLLVGNLCRHIRSISDLHSDFHADLHSDLHSDPQADLQADLPSDLH